MTPREPFQVGSLKHGKLMLGQRERQFLCDVCGKPGTSTVRNAKRHQGACVRTYQLEFSRRAEEKKRKAKLKCKS